MIKAIGITAALALASGLAQAADHALLMGVGNYQRPSANLPGIDKDMEIAQRIARSIGVPDGNIRQIMDQQVTHGGVAAALRKLESEIAPGDRVFLYYSGHGAQVRGNGEQKCTEGMFVYDMRLYSDSELESALQSLGRKAGQVIMFNDSCFSGGAASTGRTRSLDTEGAVAKFYKAVDDQPGYVCGRAVNMRSMMRDLAGSASRAGSNFVYIAASRDDQVAMATRLGSAATRAWEHCLQDSKADSNGSGSLDAKELQRCAQMRLDRMGFNQHITIDGNPDLPLSFAAALPPASSVAEASQRSAATLEDLRQAASPAFQVALQTKPQLVINQDPLDIQVRSNRDGYLYLLHVGSDGKTFNLLFPNALDGDNLIRAGQPLDLPRPNWRVRAGGPAGHSHLLAIVADQPRSFEAFEGNQGPFRSAELGSGLQRNLRIEATGIGSGSPQGRYGASQVVSISEVMP